MPLDKAQREIVLNLLMKHFAAEGDRLPFLEDAFYAESVLKDFTTTGKPHSFASNCLRTVDNYNGDAATIQLLEALKDYVGDTSEIDAIIVSLQPASSTTGDSGSDGQATGSGEQHVFISYSRRDIDFVNRLRGDLGDWG